MKQIKIFLLSSLIVFFTACGGGGSSDDGINAVDNSVLADGSTYLGYYGVAVVFGNHTAARQWTLINPTQPNDEIILVLSTEGTGYKFEGSSIDALDYGVSSDGKTMLINDQSIDEVVQLSLYRATTENCYDGYIKYLATGDSLNIGICAN